MTGKNFGYEIYKEIKGEEEFNRKVKEVNTVRKSNQVIVFIQNSISQLMSCDISYQVNYCLFSDLFVV